METAPTASELAHLHWVKAGDLDREGNLDGAIAEWMASLRLLPENSDVCYNMGRALSERGQEEEAIEYWRRAIQYSPDHWPSLVSLGHNYLERADQSKSFAYYISARDACRRALSTPDHDNDQDTFLLRCIGYAEWKLGNKRTAIETLKDAIRIEPEDLGTYDALCQMQIRMGHWKGAMQTSKAFAELPNYEPTNYRLCIKCVVSFVAALVAVTAGGIFLYKKARR